MLTHDKSAARRMSRDDAHACIAILRTTDYPGNRAEYTVVWIAEWSFVVAIDFTGVKRFYVA